MSTPERVIQRMRDLPSAHLLGSGTAMCAGCGGLQALHEIYDVLGARTVFVNAAGCMTLLATYPFTPFRGLWLYTAMASAPAGAQGVRDALDLLIAKGRLPREEDLRVVTLTGDGAAYGMGLAVQPMIAKISLSFDFIGGHGLAEQVAQLQNALSFNFYANTEIYDERSVPTESTKEKDEKGLETIKGGTLSVYFHLESTKLKHKLTLKTSTDREKPEVVTVTEVWKGADWHEREAYDMYGIIFLNHPDLRRILMPYDWEFGYPLRKDYKNPEFYQGMKVPYKRRKLMALKTEEMLLNMRPQHPSTHGVLRLEPCKPRGSVLFFSTM